MENQITKIITVKIKIGIMSRFKNLNLLLGIPTLIPEWKALLSPKYFLADLGAGITLAFIAIPLSLAIALASGFTPAAGLVTAIVSGIVCALFGGTTLAVSGPAAAMSVLIADNVEKFGFKGLVMMGFLAGLMQLLSGVLGFGKLGKYVPLPVIAGFTAGIGFIILVGQLPRAFGLQPPPESHVFDVFIHLKQYFHEISGITLLLVILTIIIIRGLPKIFPRLPAILIAVLATTFLVSMLNLSEVALIGSIPNTLPRPVFPSLTDIPISTLFINAFAIYLLASLETLLSASAIDKITEGRKHNPDQELIGQGLGNIAVSFFSGIPVTSVIARSATNVRAGGKTRRASIIHALVILLSVYAIAPLIGMIPIAALAGVLFSVAYSMLDYKEFYRFWLTSRAEGFIYGVTFLTIVFFDLIAGVQVGMIAAALIVLFQATRTHTHISVTAHENAVRISISGALTFLSVGKLAELEQKLTQAPTNSSVVLDLSGITSLDTSGASAIIDLYKACETHHLKFFIKGLSRRFEQLIEVCGGEKILEERYMISESQLHQEAPANGKKSSLGRLVHGFYKFYEQRKYNDRRLYEFIAKRQDPHTLFITCSDSRIDPTLITSSEPGELFIMRNVGNAIPAYHPKNVFSEAAAIEFAMSNLNITDIVVCGHANCGAIQSCRRPEKLNNTLGTLKTWIEMIRKQLGNIDGLHLNEISRRNVLIQIENLKTYPLIQQKLALGQLNIHPWFFDFSKSLIYKWDDKTEKFKSIISDAKIYN